MAEEDAEARIGTTLASRWRLDRILGVGAAGVVYAATHRNGSRVAIKVLRASAARDPALVARFTKEGHIGNLVDHVGVVKTLDDGSTDEGLPYLVMELLEGETLAERVARCGALPIAEALRVLDEVLGALAAAHARGLVHRDVKPANVFLMAAGGVKLLDFGIAHERVLGGKGETLCGVVLGTPAFMPPEQARANWDEVDARSDVWAAGATLFSALTGRPLREGETAIQELLLAMQPLDPLGAMAPDLPRPIRAFLDRALAFRREARFGSAGEMQSALRAIEEVARGDTGAPAPGVRARTIPEAIGRLGRAWWWVGAAAIIPLGIFLATSSRGPVQAGPATFLPESSAPASPRADEHDPATQEASVAVAGASAAPEPPAVEQRNPARPDPKTAHVPAAAANVRPKHPADPMSNRF